MAINTSRVRDRRERARQRRQTGAELYKFAEGETKIYLHPTSRPNDTHPETKGINWVEACFHRNLGGKNNLQLCLDVHNNPILTHPDVIELALKKKSNPIDLSKRYKCPTCTRLENNEITGKLAAKNSPQIQWLFGFTPMAYRKPRTNDWVKQAFDPVIYLAGVSVFDDMTGEIVNLGDDADPTDSKSATLFIVDRVGTSFSNTEYKVRADIETIRQPLKLDKGQRKLIEEAIQPGGPADLLRVITNFIKTPAQMEALMAGVEVAAESEESAPPPDQKECFGSDWEDCDECHECADEKQCKEDSGGSASDDSAYEVQDDGASEQENDGNGVEEEPEADGDLEDDPAASDADAASEDESEGDDDGEDEKPKCWATYEADDDGCKECELQEECEKETNPPQKKKPSRAGKKGKAAAAKKSESENASTEEDPDLAEIQNQAEQVASRSRTRRRKQG